MSRQSAPTPSARRDAGRRGTARTNWCSGGTGQRASTRSVASGEHLVADRRAHGDLAEESAEEFEGLRCREPDQSACIGDDKVFRHS